MTVQSVATALDEPATPMAVQLRGHRRTLLVEAARKIFVRDGLDGASVRSIAQAAGCTTGAIYANFADKNELYAAVLGDSLASLRAAVVSAIEDHPDDSQAGLRAFFDFYHARPEELWLGLYLFKGIGPSGLTPELDDKLNDALQSVYVLIERNADDAGKPYGPRRLAVAISFVVGSLILSSTGRLRSFDTDVNVLFDDFESLLR